MNDKFSSSSLDCSLTFSSQDDLERNEAVQSGVLTDCINSMLVSELKSSIKPFASCRLKKQREDSFQKNLNGLSFKKGKSCAKEVDISWNSSKPISKSSSSTKENESLVNNKTSKGQQSSVPTDPKLTALQETWKRNGEMLYNFEEKIKDIDDKINKRLTLIKQQFWEQRIRHKSTDQPAELHHYRQADRKKSHLLTHLHRKPSNQNDYSKEQFMKYIPMRELLTHGDKILTNQKIIHCKLMMQLQLDRKSFGK